LMTNELARIPQLLKLSKENRYVIMQNFAGTLVVDGFGVVFAMAGMIHPLAAAFDLYDRIFLWTRPLDPMGLDETVVVVFVAAVAVTCFVLRRVRDLRLEMTRRRQVEVELRDSLAQVRTLRGLLPICSQCKRIRDDDGYWHQVERYLSSNTDAEFTHGYCPGCEAKMTAEIDGLPDLSPDADSSATNETD